MTGVDHQGKRNFDGLAIVGPTGSGKSALALALATKIGGEIISCDSVQVYRGFDIGAAKPSLLDQQAVPHHLLDVADWHENFDAARYVSLARASLQAVQARGHWPIVVGGTGLYLRALLGQQWHAELPKDEALRLDLQRQPADVLWQKLKELDPQRALALHPNDSFRVMRALEIVLLTGRPLHELVRQPNAAAAFNPYMVMLEPPRPQLHTRISQRTQVMLAAGLVDEVKSLLARGVPAEIKPMQSIGYKQVIAFLQGQIGEAELAAAITAATRQYAKRQLTWFRKVVMHKRLSEEPSAAVLDELGQVFT